MEGNDNWEQNLQRRIKDCAKPSADIDTRTYEVDELCDLHGFCHLQSSALYNNHNHSNSSASDDIINKMKSHENWNNPSSVKLMLQAYDITDPYQIFPNDQSDTSQSLASRLEIVKQSQNRMFSRRYYREGIELMQTKKYSEALEHFKVSIQYDKEVSSNIDAYVQRAIIYSMVLDWQHCEEDVKTVLSYDPNNEIIWNLVNRLKSSFPNFSKNIQSFSVTNSNRTTTSNASSSSSQFHNNNNNSSSSMNATIEKLQQSLLGPGSDTSSSSSKGGRVMSALDNDSSNSGRDDDVVKEKEVDSDDSSGSDPVHQHKNKKKKRDHKKKKSKKSKEKDKHNKHHKKRNKDNNDEEDDEERKRSKMRHKHDD